MESEEWGSNQMSLGYMLDGVDVVDAVFDVYALEGGLESDFGGRHKERVGHLKKKAKHHHMLFGGHCGL